MHIIWCIIISIKSYRTTKNCSIRFLSQDFYIFYVRLASLKMTCLQLYKIFLKNTSDEPTKFGWRIDQFRRRTDFFRVTYGPVLAGTNRAVTNWLERPLIRHWMRRSLTWPNHSMECSRSHRPVNNVQGRENVIITL